MNVESIAVHRPQGEARHLMLLYHGFGSTPEEMAPVGKRLSAAYPRALIASIAAPYPADIGGGRQWFSLRGITDDNRMERVSAGLGDFIRIVREWQARAGVSGERTVLAGFSQGATMLLEAVKSSPRLASRVLSFGGRFAALPTRPLHPASVHLLHGEADPVIHCHHSISAAERLLSLGCTVTLDIRPRTGYAIDDGMIDAALERLRCGAARQESRMSMASRVFQRSHDAR